MAELSVHDVLKKLRRKKQMAERHVAMPNPFMEQTKREFHERYGKTIQRVFMKRFIHMLREEAQ